MDKTQLRQCLLAEYKQLWPDIDLTAIRAPLFPGASQAAEQLRRLPVYRSARTVAVTAEPALLQVRINALLDGKNLLAATPGLKQGLVRLAPPMVPINRRYIDLQGSAMFKAGKPLPLPRARLGQADMLISTALAIDSQGLVLGDGRGVLDLFSALLGALKVLPAAAPLVVLAHEKQVREHLPRQSWDVGADMWLSPAGAVPLPGASRPPFQEQALSPAAARLPVIKAFCGMRVATA